MRPREKLSTRILVQLRSSPALRRIARDAEYYRQMIDSDPREVIPVAVMARIFGVSERLLWNWIEAGLLRTQKPKPFHKRGVSKHAVLRFLNRLERDAEDSFDDYESVFVSPAGRPNNAMRKIWGTLFKTSGLTPREFATRAGVSRTTVMRAIHEGALNAWNPTPRRYILGVRPRFRKKTKKSP